MQYDPMLLHGSLSQALPCRSTEGVHGVQHICRAMLWFPRHRRFAGDRLPTPRVCCVSCLLVWHIWITLYVEPPCRGFPAHECSAGTRVATGAKRICLAGRATLLWKIVLPPVHWGTVQIGTTRAGLVNIPIAHPSCRHRGLLPSHYGSSFLACP